ncbi:MAG: translational GTPase TypA [Patescibacteria group bacterium]
MQHQKIRNIAIIAHVDHGKTTLVDGLIRQTLEIRNLDQMGDLIMDNMDQERERGITIKAKNASIYYNDYKINIVDTPGHADFGGEVERTLRMVDGVVLLVDAQEGPMPQTKFVLKKALQLGHRVIVCINKIDKPAANAPRTLSRIEDLFLDLGASDEQMDFKIIYASGVQGKAGYEPDGLQENLFPMLDTVLDYIPEPIIINQDITDVNPLQILILALKYDNFKGKMAVGKISSGKIAKNMAIQAMQEDGVKKGRVSSLMVFDGLGMKEVEDAEAGEIVTVAGLEDFMIGDTITVPEFGQALPRVKVDEPTIQMTFGVNTSPFAGKEGKLGTSRQIRERLYKELETNVGMTVEPYPDSADKFIVSGRGELHLSVLIETMRREGFELEVSKPQVIFHIDESGKKTEPFEFVEIDVPLDYSGSVMQEIGKRKGDLTNMGPNEAGTEMHYEIRMATRALIGLKSLLLTASKGTVVMNSVFDQYDDMLDLDTSNDHGSLISTDTGPTMGYSLENAQQRGTMFVGPGVDVYAGMVIGQCARDEDLELNPTKGKKLSNVRSSGNDDGIILTPPRTLSLEESLEYIGDDELVEVTPKSLRIRKRYLDPNERKRQSKKA